MCYSLKEFNLPALESAKKISFQANPVLEKVSAPLLSSADETIYFAHNKELTNLDFSALETANSIVIESCPIKDLEFPELHTVNSMEVLYNMELLRFSVPKLENVTGNISKVRIHTNPKLTDLCGLTQAILMLPASKFYFAGLGYDPGMVSYTPAEILDLNSDCVDYVSVSGNVFINQTSTCAPAGNTPVGDIKVTATLNPNPINIGDTYQGGIVFYLDGNGGGLIAAPEDQSSAANWHTALNLCANLTLGGYDDWYLPSKDELNKLYLNKSTIGSFDNFKQYWSSTEYSAIGAWRQVFTSGFQGWMEKSALNVHVRAVRQIIVPTTVAPISTFTNSDGEYSFYLKDEGDYTITVDLSSTPQWRQDPSCDDSYSQLFNIGKHIGLDFGLNVQTPTCGVNLDITRSGGRPACPGSDLKHSVFISNTGTSAIPASQEVEITTTATGNSDQLFVIPNAINPGGTYQ